MGLYTGGYSSMTISYSGNFVCLLFRWRGSVWKSIWKELVLYLFLYYVIRLVYQFALTGGAKANYEKFVVIFYDQAKNVPLTFLLGFYIALIIKRWWVQFECVTWPDDVISLTNAAISGPDEISRSRRLGIAR